MLFALRLLIRHALGLQSWCFGIRVRRSQVPPTGLNAPTALQVVLGNWVDKREVRPSHYAVTLDDDGESCSVVTHRACGEKLWTKGLITLNRSCCRGETCIWWGKTFHLQSPSAPGEIRWVRQLHSIYAFVWERDPGQKVGSSSS